MRIALATITLVLFVPALARGEPLRVGIARLGGPWGEETREALAEAIRRRGDTVVDLQRVNRAQARHGQRRLRIMGTLDLDVWIDGKATPAATELRMLRRGETKRTRLRARERDRAARIEALADRYVELRPPSERPVATPDARAEETDERDEPDESDEGSASPEPPQPMETPEVAADPAASEPTEERRTRRIPRDLGLFPRVFEGAISLALFSRTLAYRDDLFERANTYSLGAAPAVTISGRAFPLAPLRIVGLEDLGISLRGEQDFIQSSSREGVTFRTYGARWDLDLIYRFPLGRFRATAWFGYHRRVFSIDSAIAGPGQDNLPGVPNVRYEGLRLGGEGRVHVIRGLFLDLRLAYVAMLAAGAIHEELWFPRGRAGAFELGGDAIYRLTSFMDVRLGVHFTRVGHDLNPEPGNRVIVGGATDRFTVFSLGAGFFR